MSMRLEIFVNNGSPYIRIVESASVIDPLTNKRVSRKKIIKSIGPVSRFDDGKPDFVARLKASYEACDPIIDELKEYVRKDTKKETYNIRLFEGTPDCFANPLLISNTILEGILEELDLNQLIRTYKNKYQIDYDVYGFFKALIFGRILNPASKIFTVQKVDSYYEPIIKGEFDPYDVYKALDFIYAHQSAFFSRIHTAMVNKFGRTTNYIYYDVTNFFFDIDQPDEDLQSDDDKVVFGLRKNGVSKENRKSPIVQMGLLMDEQGIPISVEAFPGNTLDHLTLKQSFHHISGALKDSRYIYVCDKGIGRGENLGYAVSKGNGYLTSKSVRGSTKAEKNWMLNPEGYISIGEDFRYKTKIIKKTCTADGVEIEYTEKVLTYWSKKFCEREKAEAKSFYETVEKILESPERFRVSQLQRNSLRKYLKKEYVNRKTGELVDSDQLKVMLNMDKLKEDYDLLGQYTLITSEVNMPDEEIIRTYKNLVEIEDQFRVMKSTLETRPVFVQTKEHITAHLTICAIALIVLRMIQRQIKLSDNHQKTDSLYEAGLSADRIQAALNRFQVEKIGDVYYRFCGMNDPDLKMILDAFGINIAPKCCKINELKSIKPNIRCHRST